MIVDDCFAAPAIVVGGGVAGLATALALDGCLIVANEPIGGGASALAQGGIAAAIGSDDSPALHAADTLRVSGALAEPDIAELVARAAGGRIDWLRLLGVGFDLEAGGTLKLGREAGHGRNRIVHAGGDRTGAAVMRAMRAEVRRRPDIRVLEGFDLVDLIAGDGRAAGVLLESQSGTRLAVLAPQVVLATGGLGACFEHTTNPATSRGAGLAAAARLGVRLADLEFVQFHPTALAVEGDPLPLLTEALRGAGAILLDDTGRRFMPDIHPDAELAPRDVVARSVAVQHAAGRQVMLDATAVPELAARFPGACAIARAAGMDPHARPLPVTVAVHFHMGGIATDAGGAASMPGLWACGEVAATGLHGGNRLASNSLLEGLVFGERIARGIRSRPLSSRHGTLEVPLRAVQEAADPARVRTLRHLVGEALGPVRSGAVMTAAQGRLHGWAAASRIEQDLVTVALLTLDAALARRESRAAHYRTDHPRAANGPPSRRFIQPPASAVQPLCVARSRVA